MRAAFVCSLVLTVGAPLVACDAPEFEPSSRIDGVRILATRADRPYAAPGEVVTVDTLAVDGRAEPTTPMVVHWIPSPCINPPGDAFYGCFPAFERAFRRGADAAPGLMEGATFTFAMPDDVIATHAAPSSDVPEYGLAVVFTIACAGQVRYLGPGKTVDAVPFGCFDDRGTALGPDDFVFAYSLIYAHSDQTNENPVIDRVTLEGDTLDPAAPITLPHCEHSHIDDCPTYALDLALPDSTQERDPTNRDASGRALKEQLYAQYYVTAGKLEHDTVLLFDPRSGRLAHTENDLRAPQEPGDHRLWIVVHDDRGGVTWEELRVEVK